MVSENLLENQPIAWTPTAEVMEQAQLTRFMKQISVATWDELHEFSIRDVEKFTEEVLKFLDIKFDPPYDKLLDTSNGKEFPTWFLRAADKDNRVATAGLNITTMCLDRWIPARKNPYSAPENYPDFACRGSNDLSDQSAVIWEGEDGRTETLSYELLFQLVEKCSAGLRANGIKQGDAVGIHLPMIPATIVSLLGINRVGAIAVPVFSGYGESAIAARLNAVGAKALITCEGFPRRGRYVEALSIAKAAAEKVESIEKVFVVERDQPRNFETPRFSNFWNELMNIGQGGAAPHPTSAEDPLIILYTSGTTGRPKGIAHTHASFPIKAAQDMAFGTDVGRGTRIFWYTDIGWMMGPWLIYGALINGATVCIYDGAPDYPTKDRIWEFCAKHKVEVLGISPTLVRSLAAAEERGSKRAAETRIQNNETSSANRSLVRGAGDLSKRPCDRAESEQSDARFGVSPRELHDLSSLRILASTGEPWNPAPWWWLFEKVGDGKLPIINYSGGTEIAGGILMGNPLLPIKPCSFPAPCLGIDADILDEDGKPVERGKVGELVIKQPWIGMARGFWQEKERYLETYWRRFPGIWVHGDFAMRDKDGHWFILGRSDDTLKVAGKRVGPAEVESVLVSHPLVVEAAVIGVPDEVKGTAMVAFAVLKISDAQRTSDSLPRDHLVLELKDLIAEKMGKPLAPSKIHFVSALPKTRNAKVMRRVIRAAYLGEDPGDLSALENPVAVEQIRTAGSVKE